MIDNKDRRILEILMKNGRTKIRDIARIMKIPVTTIHKRMKKLERDNIITNYIANINYEKLGYAVLAYIFIKVNYAVIKTMRIHKDVLADIIIERFPQVSEASTITGPQRDIILKIRARDVNDLNKIIHKLQDIKGVSETDTLLVLHDVDQTGEKRIELLEHKKDD